MSAAGFLLAINIFVSGLFSAAFGVTALYNRSTIGARWLSLAYGIGMLNAVLEFILPGQSDPDLLAYIVFAVSFGAFLLAAIGLAQHYGVPTPWWALGLFGIACLIANGLLMHEPSNANLTRALIYQLPYFGAHLIGAWVVYRSGRRNGLDLTLLAFLLISGLQFIAKPYLGVALHSGGPETYLHSVYGAYSQLLTAFLLIANGVLMLLIIVRDVLAEITVRSETDTLSGLFNRRGFDERSDRAMAGARRTNQPSALVLADLDHFKTINDTLGHDVGDTVIAAFARLLAREATPSMVLGRQGGEEFAVFLPGANLGTARRYAETVRTAFAEMAGELGLDTVSASFGVVQLRPTDTLSDLLRRADAALYDAKKTGRNRVSIMGNIEPANPGGTTPNGQRNGRP